MKRTAIIIMILTIISKTSGFIRSIVLSYFYGASSISDAYMISDTIPTIIFTMIGTGIATSFIPMYSKIESQEDTGSADRFTNALLNVILIISSIVIFFSLIYTTEIVKVFASGFQGETLSLAVAFTRISIFGVYFYGILYMLKGYLHVKNSFIIPALISIPYNIIIIISIFLSSITNNLFLPVGLVLGVIVQVLFMMPFVWSKGLRYKFILDFKNEHLKKIAFIALPVILGTSVNQVNILVDRTIASSLAVGGISALTYANRLNLFIQSVFVMSLATVLYPTISKMAASQNIRGLKRLLNEALGNILILVVPVTIGTMVFAQPIVRILFGRGAFDSNAINLTSTAIFYYSIGMVGFGFREILSRAFYSLQDTKTPMINASIGVVVNIGLNIILSKYIGLGGLALATSISALLTSVLLFFSLRKKLGILGVKTLISTFLKVLFSSIFMAVISKGTYLFLIDHINVNLALLISIFIGVQIYFICIYILRVQEIEILIQLIKNKYYKAKTKY